MSLICASNIGTYDGSMHSIWSKVLIHIIIQAMCSDWYKTNGIPLDNSSNIKKMITNMIPNVILNHYHCFFSTNLMYEIFY